MPITLKTLASGWQFSVSQGSLVFVQNLSHQNEQLFRHEFAAPPGIYCSATQIHETIALFY